MYLKSLHLKHFRNLSNLSLALHPRFNIFIGENGRGKTNVIEAVYLLAFGKSFRTNDHKHLIAWGEANALIRSWVWNEIGDEERNVHLTPEKKKFLKNGKGISPNQFFTLPTVLFAPESILLIRESPQARREGIDHLIEKCEPAYWQCLKAYKRALSHRNKLLQDELLSAEEKREGIKLWERPLAEYGGNLIEAREKWAERLNHWLVRHYHAVSGRPELAKFSYAPNVLKEAFAAQQERRREEEIERGTTLVGPHRDDFVALLDNKTISHFGSQGEHRTFTLALKLAEIDLFKEVLKCSPFLLLDDVLSELDENRSRLFFSYLQNFEGQIFATATSLNLFPKSCLKEYLGFTF